MVAALAAGAATGTKELRNGSVGDAARGYSVMDREGLWPSTREVAFVHSDSLTTGAPSFVRTVRAIRAKADATGVLETTVATSRDRHSAIVVMTLTGSIPLAQIHRLVASVSPPRGIRVEETGDWSASNAVDRLGNGDLRRVALLSVPVTLLVLLVAFGSLVAALVPVALALTAVIAGFGLLGPVSQVFPVEESAKVVMLLIGMAVGVDYALFYVVRSREERLRGASPHDALATAARTSGRTVIVSGTVVSIALAAVFLVRAGALNAVAAGTIVVVLCAELGSVTVLPAVLALLGPRIDRGRLTWLPHLRADGEPTRFWPAVVDRVLRRPVVAGGLAVALLLALALPALGMRIAKPSDQALMAGQLPELRALADVRRAFPGASAPAIVVATWAPEDTPRLNAPITRLQHRAAALGLAHPPWQITANAERTAAAIFLPLTGDGDNAASRHAVAALRQELVPETLGTIPSLQAFVTGDTAEDVDFTAQMRSSVPYVIAFVLVLAFGVLMVAFRSLVVPLKAIVLNLLAVSAAYGFVVGIFEHHWAEGILGFRSTGSVMAWLPIFLFVILFGLSMDYHVFILSRVREAVDRGATTEEALRRSIPATAGVVTSAALVMVCVFALFGTASALVLKEVGVGLAAAVLLDATIVRAVLLPSTMALLGERNWYLPGPLRLGRLRRARLHRPPLARR